MNRNKQNKFLLIEINFYFGRKALLNKTLQSQPCPTPAKEAPGGRGNSFATAMPLSANGTTMVKVIVGWSTR
jgi:hypothetical protein